MNTLNKSYTLDKWDIAFISLAKSNQASVMLAKCIWGKRCAFDVADVETAWIVSYLIELLFKLNLMNERDLNNMIFDARSEQVWKFKSSRQFNEEKKPDYFECWLMVIMSKFSLTEVKYLPGYVETTKGDFDYWQNV